MIQHPIMKKTATLSYSRLKTILNKHLKWLNRADGGERANLSGARLVGEDLSGENLSGAELAGAILTNSNLIGTIFNGANLSGAKLDNANLADADLSFAMLADADLYNANLSGAKLSFTVFDRANLQLCSGIVYAQVSFTGHGECDRMLTAFRQADESKIYFCCGCFRGNEEELREFIEHDLEELKPSRLLALETVLKLISFERGVKA